LDGSTVGKNKMSVKQSAIGWYYKKFKKYPNLENPVSYNDKIQWLKIYDQDPDQIICCDKLAVKDWVSHRVPGIVIPNTIDYPAVWKTNNGSGTVEFVNSDDEAEIANKKLVELLNQPAGARKGELAYSLIKPDIVRERRIDNNNVDYKFHCCNGKVKWLQMIWDRHLGKSKTKESIIDVDGNVLPLHMDEKMRHVEQSVFCGNDNFVKLKRVAESLSLFSEMP
jgi:hypothetical protein